MKNIKKCLAFFLIITMLFITSTLFLFDSISEKRFTSITSKIEKLQNNINSIYEENQSHDGITIIVIMDTHPTSEEEQGATEAEPEIETETESETDETQSEEEKTETETEEPSYLYEERFYGRLYIPDAQIDVALYLGDDQDICDRQDSANLFFFRNSDIAYIADHNTQEFGKLFNVQVGTQGYIQIKNGEILNIKCTNILNGHNTGKYIVDEYGNIITDADYVMYTCRDGWRNIIICIWKQC